MTNKTTERARPQLLSCGRLLALACLAPLLPACSSTPSSSLSPAPVAVSGAGSAQAFPAPDPQQEASDRFHRGKAFSIAGDTACARLEFQAALDGFRTSMRPGNPGDLAFAGQLWESVRLYEDASSGDEEEPAPDPGKRDGLIAQEATASSADELALARKEIEEAGPSLAFDVPIVVNDAVLNAVAFYQFRTPKAFAAALQRSGRYLPLMREILRENGLPEDLVYVAMIESAFKSKASSRAAAKGYWQFISGTAKRYGLKTTREIDERSDPVKSTRAAAAYFRDLYEMFGDWHLAMAAYNAGEGRVLRGLQRTGARNFWELRDASALHRETRDYVPFFMASALIAKDPARFGFEVVPDPPLEFDVVEVPRPVELARIARELGVSAETLASLNGELRGRSTPRGVSAYPLRLPKGAGPVLAARLASIPAAPEVRDRRVTVRKGESLARFAARNKVSLAEVCAANDLSSKARLRKGTVLIVPGRVTGRPPVAAALAEAADAPVPIG
ncbi:MAG: transglycosylase SLT domain-containing protein, partial [Deltaproteobacteria bacterium]|nr:transglycosylase SLT domain-containing protein [Deltaproteobacteria bacterium]